MSRYYSEKGYIDFPLFNVMESKPAIEHMVDSQERNYKTCYIQLQHNEFFGILIKTK